MKLKAEIIPLMGKYYGTVIKIQKEDAVWDIRLWNNSNPEPSERQLLDIGYTKEDWENNSLIPDGWGDEVEIRKANLFSDNHYESQQTFDIAQIIVKGIVGWRD